MPAPAFPAATREINVCGMQAPEPMLSILEALEQIPDDGALLVRLDSEPYSLFRVLDYSDYLRSGRWLDERNYQLLIWRDGAA